MLRPRSLGQLALLLALALPIGCASPAGDEPLTPTSGDVEQVFDLLRARAEAAARGPSWYRDLSEIAPNVMYILPDGSIDVLSDDVVVGTIVEVEPGAGFALPGGDAPGGELTSFEDEDAVWRTVHLRIEVAERLDQPDGDSAVRVGLAIGAQDDFEQLSRGLRSMGMAVFYLAEGSPVFAYEPGIFAIVEDGNFIVPIGDDGTLSLPAFDAETERSLLAGVTTLDSLRAAVREPSRSVEIVRVDGVLQRRV